MKTAKCFQKMLSRLSREHYFFRKRRKGGEGRRGRRRPFTCEGGRRRLWSPTICEGKTINTRHCWPIDMSENLYEDIRLIDAEAQGDRLVTFLDEQHFNEQDVYEFRDFLATLEGIEFGPITFDDNEVFGASFLYNSENSEKIKEAGYSLMISSKISVKDLLNKNPDVLEKIKEK